MLTRSIVLLSMVLMLPTSTVADPLDDARRDFSQHKPLPGLPNLRKPVFIEKDALVCSTPTVFASGIYAAAANGSRQAGAVLRQNCTIVGDRMRVQLLIPRDGNQYVQAHMFRYVRFVSPSPKLSDASLVSGWVFIDDLSGESMAQSRSASQP